MKNTLGTSPASSALTARPFPPRRDYASLCVGDLLDAREAHHVYLSGLDNVVATAIGRYRIHKRDWYATHPSDEPRPPDFPRVTEPRTLSNSVVKPWSWPAVLVFVRQWGIQNPDQKVPSRLYLPDGRVVPTCVILALPDETPPPPVPGPSQVSALLGGGYACLREHQGVEHTGTLACLVYKDGTFYALTNRHVTGGGGDDIRAFVRGAYHPIGKSVDIYTPRLLLPQVFPGWRGATTYLTLDAGLVKIDDYEDWTSQVFGIGEVGETFDATEQSITLDLVGCPVRAFGGTTGVMEGEIQALFFRHKSLGGYDHVTDVLIGPRTGDEERNTSAPFTRPGDSGALWFYDPSNQSQRPHDTDIEQPLPPERGPRARRLRPVAMQWGGQRFENPDKSSSAFALASFVSTVCRALDVEIVHDWSTGHDEYWGKLAHFAIGWKACDLLDGALADLMKKNQERLGYADRKLEQGSEFRVGRDGFIPLADVPDYKWVNTRPNEGVQHFADVDIYDIHGGPSLLERCMSDPANLSAKVWKDVFDGYAAAGVGPDEGVLPFRVWQIWDAMVRYLKAKDVKRFVAAAGVLSHYIGDASQSLHCSYMHHGKPPMVIRDGHAYPVRRDTSEFKAFKKTKEYKIHSIYDETVLEVDTAGALAKVNALLARSGPLRRDIHTGHTAAVETVRLMYKTQKCLSPEKIIGFDNPNLGSKARAKALWRIPEVQQGIIESLADSTRLLADLWASAWAAGDGKSIPAAKLVGFRESSLRRIYEEDARFVPSLSLTAMVKSGKYQASEHAPRWKRSR